MYAHHIGRYFRPGLVRPLRGGILCTLLCQLLFLLARVWSNQSGLPFPEDVCSQRRGRLTLNVTCPSPCYKYSSSCWHDVAGVHLKQQKEQHRRETDDASVHSSFPHWLPFCHT